MPLEFNENSLYARRIHAFPKPLSASVANFMPARLQPDMLPPWRLTALAAF